MFKLSKLFGNKLSSRDFEAWKETVPKPMEFVEVDGLPNIDQAFLDYFEARQPWKTARYRFFYFFRRWGMTILTVTYFLPVLVDIFMKLNGESNKVYLGWLAFGGIVLAVLVDCSFVKRAADQRLTIHEIYRFFYDKNTIHLEPWQDKKYKSVYFKTAGFCVFILPLLLALIGSVSYYFSLSPLWLDSAFLGTVIFTAFLVFYKTPPNYGLRFSSHSTWWPDIKTFLKYNRVFGYHGLIFFFAPFFIGPILYLTFLAVGWFVALIPILMEPKIVDWVDIAIKEPVVRLAASWLYIPFISMSNPMVTGFKYVSFAEAILKLKEEQDKET